MMNRKSISIGNRVHASDASDDIVGNVMGIHRDDANTPLAVLVQDPVTDRLALFNLFDFGTSIRFIHELPN